MLGVCKPLCSNTDTDLRELPQAGVTDIPCNYLSCCLATRSKCISEGKEHSVAETKPFVVCLSLKDMTAKEPSQTEFWRDQPSISIKSQATPV